MDIKIITIHAMHNPGSALQAYALQEYLQGRYNAKIIDYRPKYFYSEGSKWKLLLKKMLYKKEYKSRTHKFDSFIQNNIRLTKKYESLKELCDGNITGDVFIVGSDQLWNTDFPCGNDDAFYLDFVKSGKKISYSTSVGKRYIDNDNEKRLLAKLEEFSSLAVREKSTAEYLSNILRKNVEWVCDPVFLLKKESYLKFVGEKSIICKPYVVVYLSGVDERLDMIIEEYRNLGFYIVLAGGFSRRCRCDLHIKDVGPEEFLNLIYYAECVISSSFHATAFCHIFEKNFITLIPDKNGERIISLLEQSQLRNRAVETSVDFSKINQEIDWKSVFIKMDSYISSSMNYLHSAIEN